MSKEGKRGFMKKRNKKHEKRVKKLIVGTALCALILSVSTYAWFIGMKTVNVSSFDISIATTESLLLSLDGKNWDYEVSINEENYDEAYAGNTNSWGGEGLIPISTVGAIDPATSKLIMYEKGSLTATKGGYRLMSSRVNNTAGAEVPGYVAFDLFIKNLSGEEYYTEYDPKNEEAIYLTPESAVTVSTDGGEQNTGIENSVRVAFAQIGRVEATPETTEEDETAQEITGISCAGTGNVTKICDQRYAQVWEPNDTKHVQNAINWYNESCKARTGADVFEDASYNGACGTVEDGTAYSTYVVSGIIDEADTVDVYDGEDYNTYTDSISSTAEDGKLVDLDTFTDTEKNLQGVERPTFMTLAPNSVTKVRVYVYIEGQDVDNYDFASLGKKISVAFGFTKERFYGEDIDYDGNPELPEEVQRNEAVSYTATGEITEITPKEITWSSGASEFSVPKTVTSFTFKDAGTLKTASKATGDWVIS